MASSTAAGDQQDYNAIASRYDTIETLPHSLLSQQLVRHALAPFATDANILDLGGGSGLHARAAISLGASHVDNIDLSPSMLQNCDALEIRAGRKPGDKISTFRGNATADSLPTDPPGKLYDIVMVIWTFDHATSLHELESMWRNVAAHTRSGGKIIKIGSASPRTPQQKLSKYGVSLSELEEVEGPAVKYKFTVGFNQPFVAIATNLEANFELEQARAMAKKYGFANLEVVPPAEMEIVKEDLTFWQDFVEEPSFLCVIGTKQ